MEVREGSISASCLQAVLGLWTGRPRAFPIAAQLHHLNKAVFSASLPANRQVDARLTIPCGLLFA